MSQSNNRRSLPTGGELAGYVATGCLFRFFIGILCFAGSVTSIAAVVYIAVQQWLDPVAATGCGLIAAGLWMSLAYAVLEWAGSKFIGDIAFSRKGRKTKGFGCGMVILGILVIVITLTGHW